MSALRLDGWPKAAALLFVGSASLGGCVIEEHPYDRGPQGNYGAYGNGYVSGQIPSSIPVCPSGTGSVEGVSVDTDAALTTAPGEGTGVFVEYMAGGHWHIWTSCDTLVTGYACTYEVTGQTIGGTVSNVRGENLETSDVATSACSDTAYLSTNTASNLDGMLFDAPAGATLRVTAALGGVIYPDVIYWVSGGVARSDAHANPLELTPTAP